MIMGLGVLGGGSEAAKFLAREAEEILVTDLRSKKELFKPLKSLKRFKNIKYVLGGHRISDFSASGGSAFGGKKVDLIVKNPAVPNNSPYLEIARQAKIKITNDLAIFLDNFKGLTIGITGTKGKTTATRLVGAIFKAAGRKSFMAGNVGISPLRYLKRRHNQAILEISSWQLEGLENKSVNIAVITNIFPDHLDRYRNFRDYIKAKSLILLKQTPNDIAILNRDNKITKKLGELARGRRYWFSPSCFKEENGCFVKDKFIFYRHNGKEEKILGVKDIKILGHYNLENILAATTVSLAAGIKIGDIKKTVRSFFGVPDRLELIRVWRGIKFINDTTATTPEASINAIKTLRPMASGKIFLIAGGADKKLNYTSWASAVKKYSAQPFLLKGTATPKIYRALDKMGVKAIVFNKFQRCFSQIISLVKSGDTVLLSPAAASFGMFKNEFDRGRQFTQLVKLLK